MTSGRTWNIATLCIKSPPPLARTRCARASTDRVNIMSEEADAKAAEARVLMDKGSYDSAIELFATALELR